MLFVQGGSAHRIGLLYIIIQEQKEGTKPTTVFARKISKGIDKLFDDPKLVAQKFSMLSTIPKNQQLCLYFFIPGSADGAFAKVRSIYFNMEAPTLIFYCFFTAFCKKS